MTQVRFLDWIFLVDKKLTQSIYLRVAKGGADNCNCSMCKNYVVARQNLFDLSLRNFFKTVGVEMNKEYEVCHMNKETNGLHLYSTWFDFAGQILDGRNCKIQTKDGKSSIEHFDINSNLSVAFLPSTKPADSFFDNVEEVVSINFLLTIPWTINEKEPL